MKKFKNWLIKKLGGYTKDEIPAFVTKPLEFTVEKVDLVPLYVQHRVHRNEVRLYGEAELSKLVEKRLISGLMERIKPEMVCIDDSFDPFFINLKAKIEIPSKYLKRGEEL